MNEKGTHPGALIDFGDQKVAYGYTIAHIIDGSIAVRENTTTWLTGPAIVVATLPDLDSEYKNDVYLLTTYSMCWHTLDRKKKTVEYITSA